MTPASTAVTAAANSGGASEGSSGAAPEFAAQFADCTSVQGVIDPVLEGAGDDPAIDLAPTDTPIPSDTPLPPGTPVKCSGVYYSNLDGDSLVYVYPDGDTAAYKSQLKAQTAWVTDSPDDPGIVYYTQEGGNDCGITVVPAPPVLAVIYGCNQASSNHGPTAGSTS